MVCLAVIAGLCFVVFYQRYEYAKLQQQVENESSNANIERDYLDQYLPPEETLMADGLLDPQQAPREPIQKSRSTEPGPTMASLSSADNADLTVTPVHTTIQDL